MAWRDSRSTRRRLILFSLSISLGIAALVAVGSMTTTIRGIIADQAKSLLGADLVISSRSELGEGIDALLKELPGEQAREVSFSSMIVFPEANGTRIVNVRAIEGGFPFYGTLETDPPDAAQQFRNGSGVLVEETVAQQYDVSVGDPVKLGTWETVVLGTLRKVPGDSVAFATLAPRVYMAQSALDQTGLLRGPSLARHRVLMRLDGDFDVDGWVRENRDRLREMRLNSDTVAERKRDLGRSLDHLQAFLNLVGFVALVLGAIGISTAIHAHIRQRLPHIAVLRCIGASLASTFSIYLAQAAMLGLMGAAVGVAIGVLIQGFMPMVLAGLTPFPIEVIFSPLSALRAAGIGWAVTLVFAFLPLLEVRRVSPLEAIRADFETTRSAPWWKDGTRIAAWIAIGAIVLLFAMGQTRDPGEGFGFAAGLAIALLLLAGLARFVIAVSRQLRFNALPFAWRQGLANLHRPLNRTSTLLVALGLGTFLVLTLQLTRSSLLGGLFPPDAETQPNMVLFDIQTDQLGDVHAALESEGLPVIEEAPIITMRLQSVRGKTVAEWLAADGERPRRWSLQREYRSTFRSHLTPTERIVKGTFTPRAEPDATVIPVSVEAGIANDLGVDIGDEMIFDVQGVPITTQVDSLREVEWRQVRPNFFVVFPAGVLEDAPGMHVLATRTASPESGARLQRELVQRVPNVSAIDLSLVLDTLNSILDKVEFAVRFMALFTVVTGLIVLSGTVLTGRWQRIQESILLRTLGASQRQIRQILLAEYACIGWLAALTGSLLSVAAAWSLARFAFDMPFILSWHDILWAQIIVPILTVTVGLLTSRGVTSHPPLEVLRREI